MHWRNLSGIDKLYMGFTLATHSGEGGEEHSKQELWKKTGVCSSLARAF